MRWRGMRWSGIHKGATNLLGVFAMAASCTSCADTVLLESGICGNFVIDPGEDCDGHPLEHGTHCGAPDSSHDGNVGPLGIAFATQDGISLLRGTRDRSTEYSVFPFSNVPQGAPIRIVPTNVFPDMPGDELLAFIDHPNEKSTLGVFNGNSVDTLITLTQGVKAIAGTIGQGRFDQNAPCERLVFAYRDANEVLVYSPCRTDGSSGWNIDGIPTAIQLPTGINVVDGILVADLDFDNWLDILIGTNAKPYVAWGNGDGTFISDKSNGMMNTAGIYPLPIAVAANPEFPLAVSDLNADQKIDYVFPQGVLVSNGSGHAFAFKNLGSAWTSAVVADLNANGLDDVIAGSSETSDLNFLNNAGVGVFNPSTLPTVSPVSLLAVGDFDGDLVRDVAVVQSYLKTNNESSNTLSIDFGQSYGPPAHLVSFGEVENATQIVTATIPDSESDGAILDGIADLIAVDQHIDATPMSHAILFRGNGSRALHTSRPLTASDKTSRPLAIVVAKFVDHAPEIAALDTLGNPADGAAFIIAYYNELRDLLDMVPRVYVSRAYDDARWALVRRVPRIVRRADFAGHDAVHVRVAHVRRCPLAIRFGPHPSYRSRNRT